MHGFYPHFVVLRNENLELPFTIGGLTQKGPHFGEDQNNQDAMSIVAAKETLIAVVCDGCSGGSDIGINNFSHNEFAAQSLSVLTVKHIQEFITKENDINDRVVSFLERHLLSDLKKVLLLFKIDIPNFDNHMVVELLLSTIVVVIVFNEKWYVLHGGDGLVVINGDIADLDVDSGLYIANTLHSQFKNKQNTIKLLDKGNIFDIRHILIATDGVSDFIRKERESFLSLCNEIEFRKKGYNPGYDKEFFREFRKRFSRQWENKERSDHDDRTFILIRRIPYNVEAKLNLPANNADNTDSIILQKDKEETREET